MERLLEFLLFEYSDKIDVGFKWEKWIEWLELFFIGMDINDNGWKCVLLLYFVGECVYDIYNVEKGELLILYGGIK